MKEIGNGVPTQKGRLCTVFYCQGKVIRVTSTQLMFIALPGLANNLTLDRTEGSYSQQN